MDVRKKIRKLIDYLLQISSLYKVKWIEPLHQTKATISNFEAIKVPYRELVNELYMHFLNEAIKKYNLKKESIGYGEKYKQK